MVSFVLTDYSFIPFIHQRMGVTRERHKLRNSPGRQALSTAYLLGSPEAIGETLKFAKATERFQATHGEVLPRQ